MDLPKQAHNHELKHEMDKYMGSVIKWMKFASWSAIFCHTNFCKLLSFCMPQFPHQQKTYDDNINHVGLFLGLSEKICIKHLAHEIFFNKYALLLLWWRHENAELISSLLEWTHENMKKIKKRHNFNNVMNVEKQNKTKMLHLKELLVQSNVNSHI